MINYSYNQLVASKNFRRRGLFSFVHIIQGKKFTQHSYAYYYAAKYFFSGRCVFSGRRDRWADGTPCH
jgi:hypothetical protein